MCFLASDHQKKHPDIVLCFFYIGFTVSSVLRYPQLHQRLLFRTKKTTVPSVTQLIEQLVRVCSVIVLFFLFSDTDFEKNCLRSPGTYPRRNCLVHDQPFYIETCFKGIGKQIRKFWRIQQGFLQPAWHLYHGSCIWHQSIPLFFDSGPDSVLCFEFCCTKKISIL